eukprot:6483615-Amphidinium_carterae.1
MRCSRGPFVAVACAFQLVCTSKAFSPADRGELEQAVQAWLENEQSAEAEYGHISQWDTSRVHDMSKLFQGARWFNARIGRWNTSNVKD